MYEYINKGVINIIIKKIKKLKYIDYIEKLA